MCQNINKKDFSSFLLSRPLDGSIPSINSVLLKANAALSHPFQSDWTDKPTRHRVGVVLPKACTLSVQLFYFGSRNEKKKRKNWISNFEGLLNCCLFQRSILGVTALLAIFVFCSFGLGSLAFKLGRTSRGLFECLGKQISHCKGSMRPERNFLIHSMFIIIIIIVPRSPPAGKLMV